MRTHDQVNILIVDDAPDKVLALEAVLADLGQNIVKAYSGREALRCLLKQDFSVVLLDVNMPDMDGFETASLIRQRKRSEHTPIIFVTALADESHIIRGYSLGAVDYIATPVDPEVLRTKVGVFVELYQKTETIRQQADHRVQLAREQAARQIAEEAMQRSLLLADGSQILSRSLDYQATLSNLRRALVPAFADHCEIWIASPRGELSRANADFGVPDPRGEPPNGAPQPEAILEAQFAAGRAAIQQRRAIALQGDTFFDPRDPARRENDRSARTICVPMIARDAPLGVLLLHREPPRRRFEQADIGLAEDVAGRAATALDNAKLYQTIREGERRKDEFLAMLGHELRNPLAAIMNAGELTALLSPTDPRMPDALVIIRQQALLMKRLVDDLLDVSRITSGRITLQRKTLAARDVMVRVAESVGGLLRSRRHTLHMPLPDKSLLLDADPFRLEQVLANLMINAAKYMDIGGNVHFNATLEEGEIVFRVRDTGIGINAELLPRVFDLFAQADRSLHRSEGGLGIGLTIVRALTELHGGHISVASDGPGRGAEFVVRLPARTDAEPSLPVDGETEAAPDACSLRLLVVEDQPAILQATLALLQQLGHEVSGVSSGIDVLPAVLEIRPDVVLLDIGLPEMDGYEVARRLRSEMGEDVPLLIAMTGYGQIEDRRRSSEAGFQHHLVKPVTLADLQRALRLKKNSSAPPVVQDAAK